MTIPAGTRLDRFEVLAPLGAGGMGEVYLAQDIRLGRKVALKVLSSKVVSDRDQMYRFKQEACSLLALNHPNIVTVFEVGQIDGLHFIATEFIEGCTLREKLVTSPMGVDKIIDIVLQIANALATAHSLGIIHRDIKPENIMLRPDGYVKILDLGLAKLTDDFRNLQKVAPDAPTGPRVNTGPNAIMGTVKYMSPEQARGLAIDTRTDIFSLGILIYEMIAGRAPFDGPTASDVIASILQKEPPALARNSPGLKEMGRVVRKALAKDRSERYQTLEELIADLKAITPKLKMDAVPEDYSPPMGRQPTAAASNPGVAVETTDGLRRITEEPGRVHTVQSIKWLFARFKGHSLVITIALILAVNGAALYVWWYYSVGQYSQTAAPLFQAATPIFPQMGIVKLTNIGRCARAAVSPDGKYAVYAVADDTKQSLWMRHIATSSSVQIVEPAEVQFRGLTFSHDGNYIFCVIQKKGDRQDLYQIPVLGGQLRRLAQGVYGPVSVSPDNRRLAFVRYGQQEVSLVITNFDGTGEQTLIKREVADFWGWPAWAPDGKSIIYSAKDLPNHGFMRLFEVELETGTDKPFGSQSWLGVERIARLPDNSGFVMSAADHSSKLYQIWYVSYPDGEARKITNDLSNYYDVSLTADSGALVAVQETRLSGIETLSKEDPSRVKQVTVRAGNDDGLKGISWTPDGRVVYSAGTRDEVDIWIMDADGRNRERLTHGGGENKLPSVSPDGRYVVFTSNRSGAFNIWRINIDGTDLKRLTSGLGESLPQCSPDGYWVVYNSVIASKPVLWRVSIEGGEPVQLTDAYTFAPVVSPDGKLIACCYNDGGMNSSATVAVYTIEGGPPVRLFNIPTRTLRWTADGQGLMCVIHKSGVSNIWLQPLNGSPRKQISSFTAERIFSFDISRDGRHIVFSRGDELSDAVLISRFK